MSYKASAPGSLMLLGEYAVLHGEQAVVCAIDKRIYVTISQRSDKQIRITSALGEYQCSIEKIKIAKPFDFVLCALKACKLKKGYDVFIESEFSHTVGFGSSAAVTVATLAAMHATLGKKLSTQRLILLGRKVIREVQKRGSGADVAASVLGGIVAYQMSPLKVSKIANIKPISVLYVGYKTATSDALKLMKAKFIHHKKLYESIFKAIGQCSIDGIKALKKKDWMAFGKIMNVHHGLLDAIGVNNADLQKLIDELRKHPKIVGAKISGSGLGDCIVGIGDMVDHPQLIQAAISLKGVTCEKS